LNKTLSILLTLLVSLQANAHCVKSTSTNIAYCEYERFSIWVSCQQKAALLSMAQIDIDNGKEDTSSRKYYLDESASKLDCQQTSDKTYASQKKGFDVGHLIAIDHFDDNKIQALQTNTMVNMVPQAESFNRNGAWKKTESLTECYRDDVELTPLTVLAGVIFGNDPSNDFYSQSHGLPETPDYLWKLIYSATSKSYDLWVMKNSNESKTSTLPMSRRTISSLITLLEGENEQHYIPVIAELLKISVKNPEQIELKNNPKCRGRIG
jgi:endonuclease G